MTFQESHRLSEVELRNHLEDLFRPMVGSSWCTYEADALIDSIKKLLHEQITPSEAKELLDCWANESQRRYSKVNVKAPLYLKLKKIADMDRKDYYDRSRANQIHHRGS